MSKKKIDNPFVNVTSLNEFFRLLRADLERIRGRKFKYWKVSGVRPDVSGDYLDFNIEASKTYVGDGDWRNDYVWLDLANGRCQHRAPKGSILSQWTGYGRDFFEGGCGGGGSQTGTSHRWSSINLKKYLPNIWKMIRANQKSRPSACCSLSTRTTSGWRLRPRKPVSRRLCVWKSCGRPSTRHTQRPIS